MAFFSRLVLVGLISWAFPHLLTSRYYIAADLTVWLVSVSFNPHPGNMNFCETNKKLESILYGLTRLNDNYSFGGRSLGKKKKNEMFGTVKEIGRASCRERG